MKILVTGGAGFIGSNIVEHHLKKNDEVFVVDNLSTGSENNIRDFIKNYPDHFHFEKADILTWPNLEKVIQQVSRIYHMAAVVGNFRVYSDPENVIVSNIDGSERIFRTIAKSGNTPRVIFASSSGVYGNSPKFIMKEEDDLIIGNPAEMHSNYSVSKLCDEIIGLTYDHVKNIPTTLIRLFNTIGPRQTGTYGFVVPRFIEQACLNNPITVFGDGQQTRCFCDVRDVVVALDLIAENLQARAQIVNVGLNREMSIMELANIVKERAESRSEIKLISYQEAYGMEDYSDIAQRKPDLSKFFKLTGHQHKWTLEQTVDDLIYRFREKQGGEKLH